MGKAIEKAVWTDDEIVAQCFLFFVAGFDGTSSLLMFAAYELAINQDIQQNLYEECSEMDRALNGKRFNYDDLQSMKYLDQVICETLRLWPPGIMLDRLCVRDYTFNVNGGQQIKIDKGSYLICPVYGLHRDAQIFPRTGKI